MLVADQEDPGVRQDFRDEGILRCDLRRLFALRIHRGIDLLAQSLRYMVERVHNQPEVDVAHDQDVHVAAMRCCSAGHRAEDEGHVDLRGQRGQCLYEYVGLAHVTGMPPTSGS